MYPCSANVPRLLTACVGYNLSSSSTSIQYPYNSDSLNPFSMADFAPPKREPFLPRQSPANPPQSPPPPKLPPGWKAVWNAQYKEYFFINLHTKASQWDLPTAPADSGASDLPPSGPPPGYGSGPSHDYPARQENRRRARRIPPTTRSWPVSSRPRKTPAPGLPRPGPASSSDRGAADTHHYANDPRYDGPPPGYTPPQAEPRHDYPSAPFPQPQGPFLSPQGPPGTYVDPLGPPPPADPQQRKGLLGKLFRPHSRPTSPGRPQGQPGYVPPQGPPPGANYYNPGPYVHPPQAGMMGPQQQPGRRPGLGTAGAAALQVLAVGCLGACCLGEALELRTSSRYWGGGGGGWGRRRWWEMGWGRWELWRV